jgi:hypothetical protein
MAHCCIRATEPVWLQTCGNVMPVNFETKGRSKRQERVQTLTTFSAREAVISGACRWTEKVSKARFGLVHTWCGDQPMECCPCVHSVGVSSSPVIADAETPPHPVVGSLRHLPRALRTDRLVVQ